jgi:hypothetical protein
MKRASGEDMESVTFIITIYECTTPRLVDFRRSRGDGLDFKRAFKCMKTMLADVTCPPASDRTNAKRVKTTELKRESSA